MEPRLQKRVQRYGWDAAAADYEVLWQTQLAGAQTELLARASLVPGEQVLDVACGTGLVTLAAARAVGTGGRVVGIDLSERMVAAAAQRARELQVANVRFTRMDAERLDLPDAGFDVALCALGLMYLPDPDQALREMLRVLRPGGRMSLAVWGERQHCGWSALFEIVDAEVASDVCPLFFRLGQPGALARACADAGFEAIEQHRLVATLAYASADEACDAAFVGGPVALAWSRLSEAGCARVRARYLEAIAPWRLGLGYRMPGEFVIVSAAAACAR
jgi:ubiquinone/menaquinone biosynthesis C-methylase UbiE